MRKKKIWNKNNCFAVLMALFLSLSLIGCSVEMQASDTGSIPDTTSTATVPEHVPDASSSATADIGENTTDNSAQSSEHKNSEPKSSADLKIVKDGTYSAKDEVALYIRTYGQLPSNFITKKEAEKLGWKSGEGNLWEVAEGMSIGGDRFGNREQLLPHKNGRTWTECDIDYEGGFRNAKRIVFSNDGLIYYTDDHYKSFELLYEPE